MDYSKAIELDPDYISAYEGRSQAYYRKGDYDKAHEDLRKAVELERAQASPEGAEPQSGQPGVK